MCPACDVTCITCVSIYFCIDPTDASVDFVAFSNELSLCECTPTVPSQTCTICVFC